MDIEVDEVAFLSHTVNFYIRRIRVKSLKRIKYITTLPSEEPLRIMWILNGKFFMAITKMTQEKSNKPGMPQPIVIQHHRNYIYKCSSKSMENEKMLNGLQIQNLSLSSDRSMIYIIQLKYGAIFQYNLIDKSIMKSIKIEVIESNLKDYQTPADDSKAGQPAVQNQGYGMNISMQQSGDPLVYMIIHEHDQKLYLYRSVKSMLLEISFKDNAMRVLIDGMTGESSRPNSGFFYYFDDREILASYPSICHPSWKFFIIIMNKPSYYNYVVSVTKVRYDTGEIKKENCRFQTRIKISRANRGFGLRIILFCGLTSIWYCMT